MASTSVYPYFRPLLVLCCTLGQFIAVPLTADSAAQLRVQWCSLPVLLYLVNQLIVIYSTYLDRLQHDISRVLSHQIIFNVIDCIVWISLVCNSKAIIAAFQAVDRLRETLTLLPDHPEVTPSQPKWFARFLVLMFLLVHLSSLAVPYLEYIGSFPVIPRVIVHVILIRFAFREYLKLSCIFYSCSLVAKDTVAAWKAHCNALSIEQFNRLILCQSEILSEINELLGKYLFILFSHRLFVISKSVTYFIDSRNIIADMLQDFYIYGIFIALLIYCMELSSIQYKELADEVIRIPANDLSKRERLMVRVLLAQLDNKPGDFSAAGFVKVKLVLVLNFFSVAIEYYILFSQNVTVIREVFGAE